MRSMTQTLDASGFAAAWGSFVLGIRRNFANWPILFGRSLFYLTAMALLRYEPPQLQPLPQPLLVGPCGRESLIGEPAPEGGLR